MCIRDRYEAVKAVGEELCPALGLTIPVGKDSMSMKTRWQEGSEEREMTSPLSLVISAFARVEDVRPVSYTHLHGLTYHNVKAIAAIPEMHELNIGCLLYTS